MDKEAEGYKDAWTHSLLRPITPQFENLIHDGDTTVLITKGTRNSGVVAGDDVVDYFHVQKELFEEYAAKRNLNPVKLMSNNALVDVFNMALRHTYMRDFVGKDIYQKGKDVSPDFEVFASRASGTTQTDLLGEFLVLAHPYSEAAKCFAQTEDNPRLESIVNYSGKPENVFVGINGLRPQGDYGALAVGAPEYELAQLGVLEPTVFADAYLFFRQALEVNRGNHFELSQKDVQLFTKRVDLLSTLYSTRILSWELSRDFRSEAEDQLHLVNHYAN